MKYQQITDLRDWEQHSVLVHINRDQKAVARLYHPKTIPADWRDIEVALNQAHSLVQSQPDYRDVLVYLEDGAEWDDQLGELVSP